MSRNLQRSFILCLAAAVGCQDGANTTPAGGSAIGSTASSGSGEKTYRIAVIPKGTSHEFWSSVHAGAENAAKELGNVEVLWKGPILEDDRTGQINVVLDFVNGQVDGICLAPLDSQSLIEPVETAIDAGIPVLIFDSGLDEGPDTVSYVATDNWAGGALAARRLGELLDGQGDAILLRYKPGSESTHQREEGFLETLQNDFPDINILSSDQYTGITPEDSLDKATQVLTKYRDEVDGVFSVCEPNATGTLGALEQLELTDKVQFVAFDPNAPLIDGLKNGYVDGIVLQDPVKMGYLAVKTMVEHLEGGQVERRINTGESMATPDNMTEPRMDELLHPQQFND